MRSSNNCIQSVRLSKEQLQILLDTLDRQEKGAPQDLRKFKRAPFRTGKILLHVLDNSNAVEATFRVVARNLSSDGLGFIHGQMLPPGKPVLVQIPREGSQWFNILGQVAHCRHVEGMIHEVGLKFVNFGTPKRGRVHSSPRLRAAQKSAIVSESPGAEVA